jgi:hypothetical protein
MDSKLKEYQSKGFTIYISLHQPILYTLQNGCTTHIQNVELQNVHTDNCRKQNVNSQNADKTKCRSKTPTTSRRRKPSLTK